MSARPAIAPMYRLQHESAQAAWVLLYPEGMVRLNESASAVLRRCDGTRSVDALIEELRADYAGADLGDEVRAFLADAARRGWIT